MDGPNASRITPTALDRWEDRLEDIFRGQPYDMLDAALADTVTKFPVDIQVRYIPHYLVTIPKVDCPGCRTFGQWYYFLKTGGTYVNRIMSHNTRTLNFLLSFLDIIS